MEHEKISEVELEKIVREIWQTKIKDKGNNYRNELGIEPTAFKVLEWSVYEVFEMLGTEIAD
ncbi:hypothetical protein [Treponema sp.]|uniref:hypothetical protein n=1 Tax=Treponema sp. TaxID=166 RepID=UPI003EFEBD52